jgi:ARG and Rhodanese-Phosphatase-superfamily-associated Protein domain
MIPKQLIGVFSLSGMAICLMFPGLAARAGEVGPASTYKVLPPIRHENLTIFPIATANSHDTREFLTLDEGILSGEVVISESGSAAPLVRPRDPRLPHVQHYGGGAQVNQLVLINNSKRPLILLAGEIVTGGKQDRVIGKDRIVPAESDPIDLGVFCVEPGRWTGASDKFGSLGASMAQPAVRSKAMAEKNQALVWSEVQKAQASFAAAAPPEAAGGITDTSSYARVMQNGEVQQKVDSVAAPIEHEYKSVIQQLRDRHAVGVVVAVNGEIVWADIFASTDLLEKYWPKLVRSYAAEAVANPSSGNRVEVSVAQDFLNHMEGTREISETDPGLFRQTEITGEGFKAFELTSLLPKTDFDLHVAKMAD